MVDVFTKAERSRVMRAVKSSGTTPEVLVRRILRTLRVRFRGHVKSLPGTPDIVVPSRRCVILVHGCFWHMHDCGRCRIPVVRRSYWRTKLERNRERDRKTMRLLRLHGWRVITIWECQTNARDTARLVKRLKLALGGGSVRAVSPPNRDC